MGERAGYRVRQGNEVSNLLRKQWYVGDDETDINALVVGIAQTLMNSPYKLAHHDETIGGGGVALRNDLNIGRMTSALYHTIYSPPFDSIENDINCDISDHGIYEIELVAWNKWKIWNIDVEWKPLKEGKKKLLAEVSFIEGKELKMGTGILFKWVK
jgi:hypothetical protein